MSRSAAEDAMRKSVEFISVVSVRKQISPHLYSILVLSLLLSACSLGSINRDAKADSKGGSELKEVLSWRRPNFPVNNLPIRNSATCRFSMSFNVMYMQNPNKEPAASIHYAYGSEDESDTVSFADLDTAQPKVQSNNGQNDLTVLFRGDQQITLVNKDALRHIMIPTLETYTLFPDAGVVIHNTQRSLISHPSGVMEMGYCN